MTAVSRPAPEINPSVGGHAVIGGNHPLDDAVRAALPQDLKIVSAERYGVSAWSATATITAENDGGVIVRFFVKYATGDHGKAQLQGEFRSMQEIVTTVPGLAPRPIAFGQLSASSLEASTFFFLCEFVNISNDLPDPKLLGARLAEMHRKSRSPTGKFGFHITTYVGKLPQTTTPWESSWAVFFGKLLAGIAALDTEVNGAWDELQEALETALAKSVPRLLGALQANGRTIKPCLIHGDLWEGNIGTDYDTGNLYIFDAASYYAHNEMELGIWRTDHHRMKSKAYRIEYMRNFEASEPVEQWDDRNRLYSVKTQIMYSAHVPGTKVRNAALENLRYLNAKYAQPSESAEANIIASIEGI